VIGKNFKRIFGDVQSILIAMVYYIHDDKEDNFINYIFTITTTGN